MTQPAFQPELNGTLVQLRPIHVKDWDGLFAVGGDPKVWAGHSRKDRFHEDAFRAFFQDALDCRSALTVIDVATSKIIGTSRYHGFDAQLSEVEIGWTFLAHDYWGGKYNADIKRLMLAHAFQFVETVIFWVAEENIISRKAVAKIGGQRREGNFVKRENGKPVPYFVFEISRSGFEEGPLRGTS